MKKSAIIVEEISHQNLVDLIIGEDNIFGRMGVGGYEIKTWKKTGDICILEFVECDCAPASLFPVVVYGNVIYTSNVISFLGRLLVRNNLSFRVDVAKEVSEELEDLVASFKKAH